MAKQNFGRSAQEDWFLSVLVLIFNLERKQTFLLILFFVNTIGKASK